MILLEVLTALILLVLAAGLGYHYLLLLAGRPARSSCNGDTEHRLRYALAIPAHNEAEVIGRTVAQLGRMAYSPALMDVHVVADYCQDSTAAAAQAAGATVHERNQGPRGRKGFALAWLIERLLADTKSYDCIAIFDADSQVDPQFLAAVTPYLADGAEVVQGRHVISNPEMSLFTALADADMRVNNRMRNQAKENLGLSARLMGDAMVLRREVLERHPWLEAGSLTEDRAYGLYLVTQGVRIRYAPGAVSYGQAAARWADATPQRRRWYGGAFDMQRRYVPSLWRLARWGNWDALDKLLELTLPPFSLMAFGAVGLAVAQLPLTVLTNWPPLLMIVNAVLALLALLFPFLGLVLTEAPWRSYRALLAGPFYVLWRVWISLWVRVRYSNVAWVRTARVREK